jgi:DNA primase
MYRTIKEERYDRMYKAAREEHALLLRCEGLILDRIAERFGFTTRESARQLVARGGRRLNHAMRRTKIYFKEHTS